jgi:hypothetical protein
MALVRGRGSGWALVWAAALAAGGAVAAAVLSDHHYAWAGGALGAVTGAFAPSVFEALRRRSQARKSLASLGRRSRPGAVPAGGSGPAGLLDPYRGVVDFVGRADELAGLVAWSEQNGAGRLRLVTGAGGVGKTRLAVRLCSVLAELGWLCEPVREGEEGVAVDRVRQATGRRVLLVVDYAETRVGLRGLLRAVAGDEGALKVLLLARSAGEWWDRLGAGQPEVRAMIGDPRVLVALPAVVEAGISEQELVRQAVPFFAAELEVAPPTQVAIVSGPAPARILDLHAAALVAVLQAQHHGSAAPVRVELSEVLGELLGHEERFWQGSAEARGLLDGPQGLTVVMLRQIVAVGALLGAADQDEAVRLLRRVPGIRACHDNRVSHGWTKISRGDHHSAEEGPSCASRHHLR